MSNTFDICIIIHGCPPSPDNVLPKEQKWMNWLEGVLQQKGYNAVAPDMPSPWAARYSEWKTEFEKLSVTEDTVLVGHSCGGAFLVQWLLESQKKVKKLILVAPAKIPENETDPRKNLYEFDLPENPVTVANETIIFTSNDLERHLKSAEMYKKALGARIIEIPDKGHFIIYTMGSVEFPELLEEIIGV